MAPSRTNSSAKKAKKEEEEHEEETYEESGFTKEALIEAELRMQVEMNLLNINVQVGYKFDPTDVELLYYYLLPMVQGNGIGTPPSLIHSTDIYEWNPVDLAREYAPGANKIWYFYTPRKKKYPNGNRPQRTAIGGYWKATGADQSIYLYPHLKGDNRRKLGARKSLVFYTGGSMNGKKTNWIMHEFTLKEPSANAPSSSSGCKRLDACVLCKIKLKPDAKTKKRREQSQANDSPVDDMEEEPSTPVAQGGDTVQQMDSTLATINVYPQQLTEVPPLPMLNMPPEVAQQPKQMLDVEDEIMDFCSMLAENSPLYTESMFDSLYDQPWNESVAFPMGLNDDDMLLPSNNAVPLATNESYFQDQDGNLIKLDRFGFAGPAQQNTDDIFEDWNQTFGDDYVGDLPPIPVNNPTAAKSEVSNLPPEPAINYVGDLPTIPVNNPTTAKSEVSNLPPESAINYHQPVDNPGRC